MDVDSGCWFVFDHVLLVGTKDTTYVGRPVLGSARVTALIEEQTKDAKIIVLKRRRKNNSSRRMNGHRRNISFLRIMDIDLGDIDAKEE